MSTDFRKVKAQLHKENDQRIRRELRAQRKALTEHIRKLKARRRAAVRRVREWCKRSEKRVSVRAKEIRDHHRKQANAEIAELRRASKAACARRVAKAKAKGWTAQQVAEQERREARRDEQLLTRATERVRKLQSRTTAKERRAESDDEVRGNLAPELATVWDQVSSDFKPKAKLSRTEQFLHWAEENPDEVIRLQSELGERYADDFIKEAEAENRRLMKLLSSKKRLAPDDLERLGVSREDMHEVGLTPEDPDDVLTFLQGATDYYQSEEAVPF